MQEHIIRSNLREWVIDHSKLDAAAEMNDQTKIIDDGLLSSLEIVELILFIESLREEEVDVELLEPEAFTNVDSLIETFFREVVTS